MKALVIGGSGATGEQLLMSLLQDNKFSEVVAFLRKPLHFNHPKLTEHIIDFDHPAEWKNWVKGHVLFSALGTTLRAAGSKDKQWEVDYEYQYNFASIASLNNVQHLVLVSSINAHPKSPFFYSKMKGMLEEKILELPFKKISIFQPPVLERFRKDRWLEDLAVKSIKMANKVGMFKIWQPMPVHILAESMVEAVKNQQEHSCIYTPSDIRKLHPNT